MALRNFKKSHIQRSFRICRSNRITLQKNNWSLKTENELYLLAKEMNTIKVWKKE